MSGRRFRAGLAAGFLVLVAACGGSPTESGTESAAPPAPAISVAPEDRAAQIDARGPGRGGNSDGPRTPVTLSKQH
ncbi:hypothetical protein ACWF69_33265, partial [Nocardia sp. NPDC055049]